MAQTLRAQPAWTAWSGLVTATREGATKAPRGALRETSPRVRLNVLEKPLTEVGLLGALHLPLSDRARQLRLRDRLDPEHALRRQAAHRHADPLSTVQAMVAMARRFVSDETRSLRDFEGRLAALSAPQRCMDGCRDVEVATLGTRPARGPGAARCVRRRAYSTSMPRPRP